MHPSNARKGGNIDRDSWYATYVLAKSYVINPVHDDTVCLLGYVAKVNETCFVTGVKNV